VKFKNVNKLFTRIIYYKLCKVPCNYVKYLLTKRSITTMFRFVNANICIQSDSNRCKSSYGPALHSLAWISYSIPNFTQLGLHYLRMGLLATLLGLRREDLNTIGIIARRTQTQSVHEQRAFSVQQTVNFQQSIHHRDVLTSQPKSAPVTQL
jgi:hypothetical protein